ncbi:tetratricopeptide repeat protein [Legionella sp. km535]|uniref:tetratricopeptide repeat protein n=1 Tax=Legionella sp. km535 TaxID=2498107 RepID=UPI000F8D4E01|nr:tetratricopeptide repeat protein [Legionella sp. km535]RUR18383.1 tetratricopeptide repeat protein [Legionella sp. km535]
MIRCLIFLMILLSSLQAKAFSWSDLWYTPDQQAQHLMEKGQFKKAKETFERNDWIGSAAYRAGDYEQAAELFKELNNEQGYYNQGNALAHMGQYEQAIDAYNKALKINPDNQDALYNRKLLEELLKKDKEQKQNKDKDDKNQKNKDQQNKDQQNKDQQNKDQQNKDQQNNKQDQSKTNQDQQEGDAQSEAEQEKQQAKQQWLRLIPDDPGGLLREKFLRDHLRRERGWYQ